MIFAEILPLDDEAESPISPLHYAAESQISLLHNGKFLLDFALPNLTLWNFSVNIIYENSSNLQYRVDSPLHVSMQRGVKLQIQITP